MEEGNLDTLEWISITLSYKSIQRIPSEERQVQTILFFS